VRVASYAQYDGECARFLVLAGLEEGGHPRAPVRPDLQPVLVRQGRNGVPVALDEVVKEHLAHAIARLEAGMVPLLPRACPSEVKSARCSCEVVCDFRPESREMFAYSDTQPLFVPRAKEKRGGGSAEDGEVEVSYQEADPVEDPPSTEVAKEDHKEAQRRARDLAKDVVVSAGAGSGKTRALVDRYTAALGPGCGPENVLCITFTRKATAEMRSRIRDSLLAKSGDAADRTAMRAWITALGTVSIQTIDAFAARVVTELSEDELVHRSTMASRYQSSLRSACSMRITCRPGATSSTASKISRNICSTRWRSSSGTWPIVPSTSLSAGK
jgi:hypothetical protein